MWLEQDIKNYAAEVIDFAQKAKAVADFLVSNQTAIGLEKAIPGGTAALQSLGGADSLLSIAAQASPAVGVAFAAYDVFAALNKAGLMKAAGMAYWDARNKETDVNDAGGGSE